MSEWNTDLDAAPKDGTPILFWDDLTGYQIGYWGEYLDDRDKPVTGWTDGIGPIVGDCTDGLPSHWCLLPAAPGSLQHTGEDQ